MIPKHRRLFSDGGQHTLTWVRIFRKGKVEKIIFNRTAHLGKYTLQQ